MLKSSLSWNRIITPVMRRVKMKTQEGHNYRVRVLNHLSARAVDHLYPPVQLQNKRFWNSLRPVDTITHETHSNWERLPSKNSFVSVLHSHRHGGQYILIYWIIRQLVPKQCASSRTTQVALYRLRGHDTVIQLVELEQRYWDASNCQQKRQSTVSVKFCCCTPDPFWEKQMIE